MQHINWAANSICIVPLPSFTIILVLVILIRLITIVFVVASKNQQGWASIYDPLADPRFTLGRKTTAPFWGEISV